MKTQSADDEIRYLELLQDAQTFWEKAYLASGCSFVSADAATRLWWERFGLGYQRPKCLQ